MTTSAAPSAITAGMCPDENALALLGEGALDDADRASLEAHLEACRRCAELITELARLPTAHALPARYRALRQLGAGAMGVVWEAEDTQLGRRVAVKLIAPARADDPALRARFLREARALAQLHHPNVIAVHDVGEHGDNLYLTLELVPGTTARAWLAAAPRPAGEILSMWAHVAAGLAAIHRAGLIHRDIKPDNVLVDEAGHARIADLGLATQPDGDHVTLTRTGAVIGTPLYMAPEQLAGQPATPRSDQFSLCASVWEALRGEPPFAGRTMAALAVAMTRPLVVPRGDRVPRRYFAVLARGLDPDPAKRWPSVDALTRAMSAAAIAPGDSDRRRLLWPAAIAGLVAALGAWAVWREPAMQRSADPPVPLGASDPPPRAAAGTGAAGSNALTGTLECTLEYETLVPFASRHQLTFVESLAAIYEHGVSAGSSGYRLRASGNPRPPANLSLNLDVEDARTGEHVAYIVLPPPRRRDGAYLFETGTKIPPTVIDGHSYDYLRMYCEVHP